MTINKLFVYLWCPEGQSFLQDRQPSALDHERFQRKMEIWKYIVWRCAWCVLQQFEVVVLSRLEWDLSAVTGFDYVDHVLERVSWSRNQPLVRRHARTLVDLCYTGTVPTLFTALLYSPFFIFYSLPYTTLFFKSTLYLVCPTIFTWTDPITLILDNK